MTDVNLCIVGDNIRGGVQLVQVTCSSLAELKDSLSRSVHFLPVDCSVVVAILLFSPTFKEWVPVANMGQLHSGDCKIRVTTERRAAAEVALYTTLLDLVMEARSDAAEVRRLFQEVQISIEDRAGGNWRISLAFERLKSMLTSQTVASIAGMQNDRTRSFPQQDNRPAPILREESEKMKTTLTRTVDQRTSMNKSALPSPLTPTVVPNSEVTVYCVYSGTTSQRAKAILVNRKNPNLEKLLSVLRQKFDADLSLGYIDEDGSCTEVTTTSQFAVLLNTKAVDSLTLQCWLAPTMGEKITEGMLEALPSSTIAPTPFAKPLLKSMNPRVRNTSSALGRASSRGSSRGSRSVVLGDCGVAWNAEQLDELFNSLDVDNTGFLDKAEIMNYFCSHYDGMGVDDSAAQFEKYLENSGEMADGKISFDEFAVVMLKIAQW